MALFAVVLPFNVPLATYFLVAGSGLFLAAGWQRAADSARLRQNARCTGSNNSGDGKNAEPMIAPTGGFRWQVLWRDLEKCLQAAAVNTKDAIVDGRTGSQ